RIAVIVAYQLSVRRRACRQLPLAAEPRPRDRAHHVGGDGLGLASAVLAVGGMDQDEILGGQLGGRRLVWVICVAAADPHPRAPPPTSTAVRRSSFNSRETSVESVRIVPQTTPSTGPSRSACTTADREILNRSSLAER